MAWNAKTGAAPAALATRAPARVTCEFEGRRTNTVNAVILSAGRGRRLLPLTKRRPKCLLPVGGRSILEWQVRQMAGAGVNRCTVVTGFGAERVAREVEEMFPRPEDTQTLYNPYYAFTDNLVSCWHARGEMEDDFLLVNGDTLFEPAVLGTMLDSATAPISLCIATKSEYDSDDMKVQLDGSRLVRIGKDLPAHLTDAESIGMLLFRGDGPQLFRDQLASMIKTGEGNRLWYLSAIDQLAKTGCVSVVSVDGYDWAEVDAPEDLDDATRVVSGFPAPRPVAAGFAATV